MATNPNIALLTQAKAAKHALVTGTAVTKFVDQNGESVQYNSDKVSLDALDVYIRELEYSLRPKGTNFRRGAIGYIF